MKIPSLSLAFLLTVLIVSAQDLIYPKTKMAGQTDNYFGTNINDPYRWLEDDNSPATSAWVQEQNKVTENYLSKIPFRKNIKERLTKLWNFPKASSPFKAGKNYF